MPGPNASLFVEGVFGDAVKTSSSSPRLSPTDSSSISDGKGMSEVEDWSVMGLTAPASVGKPNSSASSNFSGDARYSRSFCLA